MTDFDGLDWETARYRALLLAAADRLRLAGEPGRCRFRAAEIRHGIIRADLRLTSPGHGGRRAAVPGRGLFRAGWALPPAAGTDHAVHAAEVWVESVPELPPGGHASIRLAPISPEDWPDLRTGDVITMHEGSALTGTAAITQVQPPAPQPPMTHSGISAQRWINRLSAN